jgi:hypothetical protein
VARVTATVVPSADYRRPRQGIVATATANVRHGGVVAKPGARFAVVVARFNDLVTKLLLDGACGTFAAHGVDLDNVEVSVHSMHSHLHAGWLAGWMDGWVPRLCIQHACCCPHHVSHTGVLGSR